MGSLADQYSMYGGRKGPESDGVVDTDHFFPSVIRSD